jgi:hypothetical protein
VESGIIDFIYHNANNLTRDMILLEEKGNEEEGLIESFKWYLDFSNICLDD